MKICGVEYKLKQPYVFPKIEYDKLHFLNEEIQRLINDRVSVRHLPCDFDLSDNGKGSLKQKLAKHLGNTFYASVILARLHRFEQSNNILTVIFKRHFHWPEGHFGDGGKCWHSYNNASPRFWEDAGAWWITVFIGEDKKPYGRAGVIPLTSNQVAIFNPTGISMDKLADLFIRPGYKKEKITLYNQGDTNDTDDRVGYTNEATALYPHHSYPNPYAINISESGYEEDECVLCGCNIITKYASKHKCGFHHPIGREYKLERSTKKYVIY